MPAGQGGPTLSSQSAPWQERSCRGIADCVTTLLILLSACVMSDRILSGWNVAYRW
jgi:hypothetical protein